MKKLIFLFTLISINATAADFSWTNPTFYTDESPLTLSDITAFKLYCRDSITDQLVHTKQIVLTPTTANTTQSVESFEIPYGNFHCSLTAFANTPSSGIQESGESNIVELDNTGGVAACQFDPTIAENDPSCPAVCPTDSSIPITDPTCVTDILPPPHYNNTFRKLILN